MVAHKPLIFISCGQYTAEEKQLGQNIRALIEKLRPDAQVYFAENQSTVEGLSQNILGALFRSAAFVCVMHRRGDVTDPHNRTLTRGSVWIEQEIAVAAFMQHILGRSIPVLFYRQAGVGIEGIRSVLLMNPRVEFTREDEVLENLRGCLPQMQLTPYTEFGLEPLFNYRLLSTGNGERHAYQFTADVINTGDQKVGDFKMRVFSPRLFLEQTTIWGTEEKARSSETHVCFVLTGDRAPGGLYPGDHLDTPLTIDYFVDGRLFHNREAMSALILVELYSESMRPKKLELPFSDYQQF